MLERKNDNIFGNKFNINVTNVTTSNRVLFMFLILLDDYKDYS